MINITEQLSTWLRDKPFNTADSYKRSCQDFFASTRQSDMSAITPGDILDWKLVMRREKRSDQTVVNALSRVARFFDYAIAHGWHPGPNPARDENITRPVLHGASRTLTIDQVRHTLRVAGADTATGARASALILVALANGEPLKLRWADCAKLPPAVVDMINRYARYARTQHDDGDDFVFVAWKMRPAWRDDRRAPITRAQMASTLSRLGRRAGLADGVLTMRTLTATARALRRVPRSAAALERLLAHPLEDR